MRLIYKLLNRLFGYRDPGKLRQFRAEVEMANVRLTWQLPAVSQRQRPIAHVLIDARVSVDLPWTQIAIVTGTTLLLEDVAPGEWFYRGRAVDDQGIEGPDAFASVALDYDAPGALVGFAAGAE